MSIETTLTDELRTVASEVATPPPPVAGELVRQAERQRLRTRLRTAGVVGVAAAAVLAAIAIGSQAGKPDASPSPAPQPTGTPTSSLAMGDPLRTYLDPTSATLYLDGVAVDGRWVSATTTGDLTVARPGPGDDVVAVLRGTVRVGTLHWVLDGAVLVSPGSRRIAWTEDHGSTVVVVAAVGPGGLRELGRLPVPALGRGADDESRESLLAVDDDGAVTYGGVTGGHAWTPGGTPVAADVSAYLHSPAGFPEDAEDIRLSTSGSRGAWLTGENDPGSGGGVVSYRSVTFQERGRPGTRETVTMPADLANVNDLYWESRTDVVLVIGLERPEPPEYVRCDTTTASCTLAPGWSDH